MKKGAPALALCAAITLAACSSTQDESARLARSAKHVAGAKGQTVTRANPEVRVLATTVLHNQNGTAVVVALRNVTPRTLVTLPIEINVTDQRGRTLFRNDTPGLEPSLIGVPVLEPAKLTYWVNDQVAAGGTPTAVKAVIGRSPRRPTASLPRITLSAPTLSRDPTSGLSAVGTATNRSSVTQVKLTIYCVALRAGRVVAAGRAGVPLLAGGPGAKPARFTIFFIGDPSGARLVLSAPPTVLS